MYTVEFDHRDVWPHETPDLSDALFKGIEAGLKGVGSSIYQERTEPGFDGFREVFGIEVDTKVEDGDPTFPVIIHDRRAAA